MKIPVRWTTLFLVLCTLPLAAQDAPGPEEMMAAYIKAGMPGEAHRKLEAFTGTWDATVRMWHAPGSEPDVSKGVATNRMILGGRWLEQRFESSFAGSPFEGIGYTGYDNVKKQYVGTWIDSMSSGVMLSKGEATGPNTFLFHASSDDPLTGKPVPMEETMVIHDANRHVFEMFGPGPDGKMFKNMEIEYVRRK